LPNYFVDTSALAKVYHQEAGAEFMRRIVSDPASRSFVSHLAIVEMESVLSIKARTGEIDERQVETARRCLRADLSQRRFLVALPIQPRHFHAARLLLLKYGTTEGLILDRFQDETNNDTIAACQDHATSIGNSSQKRKPWLPKPPISDS
jgi:uncharacterized protein with PIN domain